MRAGRRHDGSELHRTQGQPASQPTNQPTNQPRQCCHSLDHSQCSSRCAFVPCCRVCCRVLPSLPLPLPLLPLPLALQDSHCFSSGEASAKFQFSGVLGPSSDQAEVFARSTQPLLDDSIDKGQNTLVFAYGLTKSGKTYTMFGKDGEQQGIIPRAVNTVFDRVSGDTAADGALSADRALSSPASLLSPARRPTNPTVLVSFLEIYNDKLRDLLTKERGDKAGRCELHNCGADGVENGEVYVKGLREVEVSNRHEAMALLKQGQRLRQKAKTELNADSSRSHAVFTLKLLDEAGHVWCRLSIVDLAGSERTNRTKTQAGDERRKEASNINQSLVVLGRCLEALRSNNRSANKKQQLVPYRDSTLTRLFKDSLSGWGRTVMIVNVSQVHADYDETVLALKYASIAKEVTIVAKVDAQLDVRELKRKHRLKQLQDAANKRLEEEEEAEEDDDEEEDSDSSPEDDLPVVAVDDEQQPVTVHQPARRDDSREEECFELTEAVYLLKQENVAVRADMAQQEQQLREQYTAAMEQQVEEAELRAKRSVEDERQRTTRLMEAKFRLREQHMKETATELDDKVKQLEADIAQHTQTASQLEAERLAALQKSDEAAQKLSKQLESAEAQRQTERRTEEQQRQQLTEQLQTAQAEVQAVREELKAARQTSEAERAVLLVKLATAEAEVAAITALLATETAAKQAALQQMEADRQQAEDEQSERDQRDKRDKKERDDRDKQRDKEAARERTEWEKARKAAEKERSKREKEVEASQAAMDDKLQQLQAELDAALAAHEDSKRAWQQQEVEHKQQLSNTAAQVAAQAKDQQAASQQQTESLLKEKEAQLAASLAWLKGQHDKQTAELKAALDDSSRRIEELEEQKRDIERRRQAEAAIRVKDEAARQEDEQKREQERVRHQDQLQQLAQLESVCAEYNKKEAKQLAVPAFIALVQSLLDNKPKPTADIAPALPPAPVTAQPATAAGTPAVPSAAVAVRPAVAVPVRPAAPPATVVVAAAAPAPSAAASAAPAPPAKPSRTRKGGKTSKRDSMDDFYDGYDEKLVSAAIAHASVDSSSGSSGVGSGLAALARKAKARLSSATDSLRFNSSRTAPASSLHHALNESKAVALIASAATASVESTTSAAAANNSLLLSPQVQRALKATGRRSRSKSRKGKENDEAADPYDFERALAADGNAGKDASKASKAHKKKREQELLAAALNKATAPAVLSESAHFDRVVMGDSTATAPHAHKYGRQPAPLVNSNSSNSNAAPELPVKPKMLQPGPTPVAKRTRQHTSSK